MRKIFLLFILISSYAFSQSINDYQYVIVPAKFNEFKEKNRFGLNVSTKLLLQKYGFKAFLATDSIPTEIVNANCRKVYADLVDNSNLFSTKIKIVIKDCRDTVLFETDFGKSNEKELNIAYNIAMREVSKSFAKLNYKYNGKNDIVVSENAASEKLESTAPTNVIQVTSPSTNTSETFYFAQPIANGYQVVDNEPKVIMKFLNTSQKDVFIGVKGTQNGVVISKNGQWFFEYYENGKLISELLKLKF